MLTTVVAVLVVSVSCLAYGIVKTLSKRTASAHSFSFASPRPLYTASRDVASGNSLHTLTVMDSAEALLLA